MRNGVWLGRVPLARLGAGAVSDADSGIVTTAQAVVLDFWGPGCPPCVQYKPIFDEVSGLVPRDVLMASVNIQEAPDLVARYGIQATPTTLFLSTGTEVNRIEGKASREDLISAIESAFSIQVTSPASVPAQQVPPAPPPQSKVTQQPGIPPVQYPGPTSTGVMVGVVAIVLSVAGLAIIFGRKKD